MHERRGPTPCFLIAIDWQGCSICHANATVLSGVDMCWSPNMVAQFDRIDPWQHQSGCRNGKRADQDRCGFSCSKSETRQRWRQTSMDIANALKLLSIRRRGGGDGDIMLADASWRCKWERQSTTLSASNDGKMEAEWWVDHTESQQQDSGIKHMVRA